LKQFGAEIQYLTDEFRSDEAERKTSVEIVIIKCKVPAKQEVSSFILSGMAKAEQESYTTEAYELVSTDYLEAMLARYRKEVQIGRLLIQEVAALRPHVLDEIEKEKTGGYQREPKPLITVQVAGKDIRNISEGVNQYMRKLRRKYWSTLLNDGRFTASYTSNVLKELERKLNDLELYDFTIFNIQELRRELNSKILSGIEAATLELFDKCSANHTWYPECNNNVHYYNGWRTNGAHMVKERIILPMSGAFKSYSSRQELNYDMAERLGDLVKVFNYFATEDRANVRQLVAGQIAEADRTGNFTLDLRYFDIKIYKKGTVHIKIKDKLILNRFNLFAAMKRRWLPPNFGKARYEDMQPDEKQVVDNFCGKQAYEAILKDPDKYIISPERLALPE
jgi:hypothetical protein